MGESTRRALELIATGEIAYPSQFARLMWPDSPYWSNRIGHGRGIVSGAGVAMAGGSFLGKLRKAGYIGGGFYRPDNMGRDPLYLTAEGRKALEGGR